MVEPKSVPEIDDHVKITGNDGDWSKKKVVAIKYKKLIDRYEITFADGTSLDSRGEEWGYDSPSGFNPVKLEIIYRLSGGL